MGLFLISFLGYTQPILKFTNTKKNFGYVKKGEIVSLVFDFKNAGNEPLIINDAKAECSCTTVNFPKQPIAPNQIGKIEVVFDTKSTYDRQDRIVEITSNAKKSLQKIRFKGVVLTK